MWRILLYTLKLRKMKTKHQPDRNDYALEPERKREGEVEVDKYLLLRLE